MVFVIQIPKSLDPNLKQYLNSLKIILLKGKTPLRLIILEGDKCIAAQSSNGQKVEDAMIELVHQFTDLAHFLTAN